jgi:hypothetical protein
MKKPVSNAERIVISTMPEPIRSRKGSATCARERRFIHERHVL